MSETPPIHLNQPDAGNRDAGEMLRRAREAQGLTLEALAMILKVTPGKLMALEAGRFDELPDANYVRALAQTVCRAVKVDAAPVLAALPAARPSPLGQEKPPLNQPFKETRLAPQMFEREGGVDLSALLKLKWLAPLGLLLAAAAVYMVPDAVEWPAWLQHSNVAGVAEPASAASEAASDPDGTVGVALGEPSVAMAASEPLFGASGAESGIADAASAGALVVPPVQLAASSPTTAVVTAVATSTAALPSGTPAAVAPTAGVATDGTGGVTGALVLRATDDAWMEVVDGAGTKRLSRLVKAGETLAMGGVAPWTVRIGNVAGVQVTLRGQPVDLSAYARNNVARLELK